MQPILPPLHLPKQMKKEEDHAKNVLDEMRQIEGQIDNHMRPYFQIYRKFYVKIFPDLVEELKSSLKDCYSVLDLGCGKSSPIQHLNLGFTMGIDVYEPYLRESKEKGIHDQYLKTDVLDIDKQIKEKSFDAVIMIDLIEHLSKEDGAKLIRKAERIAEKKVIVFTPNGFSEKIHLEDDNIWQKHKSGWKTTEMKELGFEVKGFNGIRPLRGEHGEIRYSPKPFWFLVSGLTQLAVKNHPDHAFQLFCVKDFSSS